MTEYDAPATYGDVFGGVSYIAAMLSTILGVQSMALEWHVTAMVCVVGAVGLALCGNAFWNDGYVRAAFERVGVA